jgi:uncharacterized protein YjbJ (UPF0337 family)
MVGLKAETANPPIKKRKRYSITPRPAIASQQALNVANTGTFPRRALFSKHTIGDDFMDKDRIKGSAKQAKGKMKEVAGKATGDKKTEAEGKTEKAAGKVRNAIGGMKDAVRGR